MRKRVLHLALIFILGFDLYCTNSNIRHKESNDHSFESHDLSFSESRLVADTSDIKMLMNLGADSVVILSDSTILVVLDSCVGMYHLEILIYNIKKDFLNMNTFQISEYGDSCKWYRIFERYCYPNSDVYIGRRSNSCITDSNHEYLRNMILNFKYITPTEGSDMHLDWMYDNCIHQFHYLMRKHFRTAR